VGHPFILGSECDVLSVQGCEQTIKEKVQAFVTCECGKRLVVNFRQMTTRGGVEGGHDRG
jgi:hypothetical protein